MQRDAYTMTRLSREMTNTNSCANMIVCQNNGISSVDMTFILKAPQRSNQEILPSEYLVILLLR